MMNRVLVLDNDRAMRDLLALALRHGGFEALPAATAEEAEALLGDQQVDHLLLDLHLGGGHSGVSLVQRWRRAGCLRPFLILTGTPDDPELNALEGCPGFAGVIAKPFSIDQLVERLRALASVS